MEYKISSLKINKLLINHSVFLLLFSFAFSSGSFVFSGYLLFDLMIEFLDKVLLILGNLSLSVLAP